MSPATPQIDPEILRLSEDLAEMREEFRATLMLQSEDVGWKLLTGRELEHRGPHVEDLHKISERAREMTANPLIKRAIGLRQSYVWSKQPVIPTPAVVPGKAGRKSALERFLANPINQKSVLNSDAHEKMELAAITDGCFLLLGDRTSKTVRPIPISEIIDVLIHDDFPDEIQAYKRQWTRFDRVEKKEITETKWFYVDTVPAASRPDFLEAAQATDANAVAVDKSYDVIDFWANTQVGWTLGTPDSLAAIPWAQMYVELMQSGKVMTDQLAKFVGRITNKTKAGNAQTGAKVASSRGAGKFATMAVGNEMEIFGSAGKTYDFGGIRPVAAMVAAAMEVSIVHLLSDPGAAGSSYGSASNLDLPTKRAIVQRQQSWTVFLQRVLRWATNQDVEVVFPTLDEPDPYREAQTVALGWQSGALHADEVRPRFATIANVELLHPKAPDGILTPNNVYSLARRDIDKDVATSAGSPDQGRSNGVSNADSSLGNDERTDLISTEQLLQSMKREDLREFILELLA